MDGLYGPMIVYGPSHQPYDIDLGPVMVSDYSHQAYFEMLENILLSPPHFPTVHNNLINGKGIFDCSVVAPGKHCTPNAGLSKFQFKTGKTHRLRLINVGSAGSQKFTIDNHEMTVIANDYVDVQPYTTKVVTLGIGQRADVLVKATGKPTDAVWMRADLDLNCLNLTSTQTHGLAAIYYPHADHDDLPKTQATQWESHDCTNDPLEQTVPYYPLEPPRVPSVTQQMVITNGDNSTGAHLFFVNGQSFHANYK
jgi:FtsP/CotA-like multicopper oxidase with cupredoxin domain